VSDYYSLYLILKLPYTHFGLLHFLPPAFSYCLVPIFSIPAFSVPAFRRRVFPANHLAVVLTKTHISIPLFKKERLKEVNLNFMSVFNDKFNNFKFNWSWSDKLKAMASGYAQSSTLSTKRASMAVINPSACMNSMDQHSRDEMAQTWRSLINGWTDVYLYYTSSSIKHDGLLLMITPRILNIFG